MALGWFGLVSSSFGYASDPATVDQSTAIVVEGVPISRYIVDKNYNLFCAQWSENHRRAPTRAEKAEWFRRFLGQTALKAHLVQARYLERDDVAATVAQMSRYILTKSDGPLYATLYDHGPISPERLRTARDLAGCTFDAFLVRFDSADAAHRALAAAGGLTFFSQTRTADADGAEIHDGPIRWPFHPFEEITDDLARAHPGEMLGPISKRLGVYYAIVRGIDRAAGSDRAPDLPDLERSLRLLDENQVRRVHRTDVLHEAHFEVRSPALAQMIARLPVGASNVPPASWEPLGDTVLATYAVDGKRREITARDFAVDFNHRMMRTMPTNVSDLAVALEEMVVEEYDFRTACRLHLDRTPRFIEDQRNFALNQALAAYENETLRPRFQPTVEDLRAYAATHREAYAAPVEARGTLYLFANDAEAVRAFAGHRDSVAPIPAVRTIEDYVVHRDGPPQIGDYPNRALIAAANDTTFGPVRYAGMSAVFLKRSSGPPVDLPFAIIEAQVRRDFVREKLDAAEVDFLRQSVAAAAIEVRFDFAAYGMPAAFLSDLGSVSPTFRSGAPGTPRDAGPKPPKTT